MEFISIVPLVIVVILLMKAVASTASTKRNVFKNNTYAYTARDSLMSKTETEFFVTLDRAVNERYYVFPQVHLSALFDHRVNGQKWKYAFSHINGKSVDYVLCDRDTLIPAYGIELDDVTHERSDRVARDKEVERIFEEARVPLVRFKRHNISDGEIIQALTNARLSGDL